jgi:hypothetical protein
MTIDRKGQWSTLSIYGQGLGEYTSAAKEQTSGPIPVWLPKTIFMEWNHKLSHPNGWKLHISVHPDDADQLAWLALPMLQFLEAHHKVIGPWVDYETFNRESKQRGKFITVYSGPSVPTTQKVLDWLEPEFKARRFKPGPVPADRDRSHTIPEKPIGTSGLFFYRWSPDYTK